MAEVLTGHIPDSLTELEQWVLWRYERRNGATTKVPYQANGIPANSADTNTWCTFDEASAAHRATPTKWDGIGFVFSPSDKFFGIDLDDCLDGAGRLKSWAQPIMERFSDTYAEVSPSGGGIKIFGQGELPGHGTAFPMGDGRVEIYDRSRFFTVTGKCWSGELLDVEEHQANLNWLLALSPHGQRKVPFTIEGKIPKGTQHDTLVSLAGTMRARGCQYPEIEAALLAINRTRLEAPAPDANIQRIAASVCKYPPAHARTGGTGVRNDPGIGGELCPQPLGDAAFFGLAGDIVRAIQGQSEADPAALLLHVLVAIGNLVGRGPYYPVGGGRHYANEDAVFVGRTSSARKGTAMADIFSLLRLVDPDWASACVASGLASGEGLINAVRDKTEKQEAIRDRAKKITGYQTVVTDEGVTDKRLLVIETEFASVLRVAGRDGNTLSNVYRQAWDSGDLRILNKNSPVKATGAHISIIGHITREELLKELSHTDRVNGFGNRNLWVWVQRSQFLPDAGDWNSIELEPLVARLRKVVAVAKGIGAMCRDAGASALWHEVYEELCGDRGGLFGKITSRAEAHVLRLSCIYALLDCSAEIRLPHLQAALAIWKYCEESAKLIFGDGSGDRIVEQILKALRSEPSGLSRNGIRDIFSGHRSADEINRALSALKGRGLAECVKEESKGRPVERWFSKCQGPAEPTGEGERP